MSSIAVPAAHTIGRTFAVILMIVLLVVGVGVGVLVGSLVIAPSASSGLKGDILIGDLLPRTGGLASFGTTSKAATEQAAADVNSYLASSGAGWNVKLVEEDTATSPSQALSMVQTLLAQGVKVAVGPQSSGEVRQIKDYVNSNHLVIISQSSTATDLGNPNGNDYIFRFAPNDTFQGLAIGRVMRNAGATVSVQLYRNDAWGVGLSNSSSAAFIRDGGTLYHPTIGYAPAPAEAGTGIPAIVAQLDTAVGNALATVGNNATKVAVQLISFDEGEFILKELNTNPGSYPHLTMAKLHWFGSDGTAQSSKISGDSQASTYAQAHNFTNTIFAASQTTKFLALQQKLNMTLGSPPEVYAYGAYDAVWVLALAIQSVGKYDPVAVQKVLSTSYSNTATAPYSGASGAIVLNSAGDRAFSDYDLWVVKVSGTTWTWSRIGTYNYATDSVTLGK